MAEQDSLSTTSLFMGTVDSKKMIADRLLRGRSSYTQLLIFHEKILNRSSKRFSYSIFQTWYHWNHLIDLLSGNIFLRIAFFII